MVNRHFYVCSTDETHDIITVLPKANKFCHGHFDNIREAIANARATARNSGSYYLPVNHDTNETYCILQLTQQDKDCLVLCADVEKMLSHFQENLSLEDVKNNILLQESILSILSILKPKDIIATRDASMRKRARFCRNSPNNIAP